MGLGPNPDCHGTAVVPPKTAIVSPRSGGRRLVSDDVPPDDHDTGGSGGCPQPDDGATANQASGWRPWVVMGVVLVGSYLVVLNTTVLGVALPDIARDLGGHAGVGVDWVITVYLLAVVGVQPVTAWLADRWGQRSL